ncbi:MAG: mechanosensitive ion channel family protein [Candidatus Omnitrophica bacterium]|nr:mechanosensitive ion channel family protein [Candidatus Omnitrophota bacterium]
MRFRRVRAVEIVLGTLTLLLLIGQSHHAAAQDTERATERTPETAVLERRIEELAKESATLQEQVQVSETQAEQLAQQAVVAEAKLQAALKHEQTTAQIWMEKAIRIIVILFLGALLFLLLKRGVSKLDALMSQKDAIRESEARLRAKTLSRLAYWLGAVTLVGYVLYGILETIGINVAPLLAGVGIAGLAFGFGGQYLIRDLINGIFILFEGQYRINDVIKVGDLAGVVENVNLRVTVLRDLEGRVIYIPNGEIKAVINMTKEWSRAVFNIGVAYKENVDRVMDVLKELGRELRQDAVFGKLILEDLQMLGVDEFGESQVTIKCFFKTVPIKQWDVAREFRRRVKNRFDELGIEIPFPHRTLYWGAPKESAAAEQRGLQQA